MRTKYFIFALSFLLSASAHASGMSNLRAHDHSSAAQGARPLQAPLKPKAANDGAGTYWSAIESSAGSSAAEWGIDILNTNYAFDTHGMRIRAAAGKIANFRFSTDAAAARWTIKKTDAAESGSNAGSNLQFLPHQDNGTAQSFYIEINRATGALSSTKACDAGYTRRSPNYCSRDAATFTTQSASCTAVTKPTGALMVDYDIILAARSENSAGGPRTALLSFYSDSGCTTLVRDAQISAWEFAAVSNNTVINTAQTHLIVPSSTSLWVQLSGTTNKGADARIAGYWD